MDKRSKREKIIRIRKRIILILIILLSITLIVSFNNYKKDTKKIAVKESIRELILTVEVIQTNKDIDFQDSDTISSIIDENGEKLEEIEKCSNIEDFKNIKDLTIGDARKILNDEVDFKVNKEGKFTNIK